MVVFRQRKEIKPSVQQRTAELFYDLMHWYCTTFNLIMQNYIVLQWGMDYTAWNK